MMNLRILKKLSKFAAPVIVRHYPGQYGQAYLAERGENYHGLNIRCHCPKEGRRLGPCEHHYHPLPGTPMVGAMEGYYEPEWEERTAYEWLHEAVRWQSRPDNITDDEWAEIMRVARVTTEDQKFIADMLNKQVAELEAESINRRNVEAQ